MKIKPILSIFFVSLGLWACGDNPAEQKPAATETEEAHDPDGVELTPAQYETAGITLGGITTRGLSDVVTANGFIDIPPQNLVSVSAPLGGFVRKTSLLQGMKVRKGQVVAVVENPDFIQIQQDYLETESQLAYAETEYERQKELSSENVGAKKVFQQATTERRTLKARLAGLRERLRTAGIGMKALEKGEIVNHANILSPISGTVTAVNVNLGMFVNPTDVMFEIVDTDHLHVELSIFEQDISKIKIGQKVRYTVADGDGREGMAEVYLINPKINEDRTVRVHCHLEDNGPKVLPHNYVKATVETGSNPVPSLPDGAVMDFAGKSYVFVGKGREQVEGAPGAHLFEMVEVQKGVSEGGYTQVTLPDDIDRTQARIVVKGAYALLSKMKNSEEEGHGHENMEEIILGGVVLSFIHAVIPSHWLPFVTIGSARGWDRTTLLKTTFLAGAAHTLSTTVFGLLVGFAGFQLSGSQQLIAGRIVPLMLLILGLWFVMRHYLAHPHSHLAEEKARGRSYGRLLLSLVVIMFFSPCFEISAYFLSAGAIGWRAVAILAAIYNVLTLGGMLIMVGLGRRGLERLDIGWLRHNEQLITGLTLCGLAVFNFFIDL